MSSGLHVKYPLFLSDFNVNWIFSTVFKKLLQYRILRKFLQWEISCSVRTGGRTNVTKLIVNVSNFANAPKTAVGFDIVIKLRTSLTLYKDDVWTFLISRLSPYRAVSTLHYGCEEQSVDVIQDKIAVCYEINILHIIEFEHNAQFLGAFARLRKLTIRFVMPVHLSVCPFIPMEQVGSHWMDFYEIWYLSIIRKFAETIQISLQTDKNNGYFTQRPICFF